MQTVKVKDHPGLVRDMATGAILNTDTTKIANYQAQKRIRKENRELRERLDRLEQLVLNS